MCKNTLQNDVQEDFTKQFTKNVQEKFTKRCAKTLCKNNLQNDVQEHCADAQEQKKFFPDWKKLRSRLPQISFGKIVMEIKRNGKNPSKFFSLSKKRLFVNAKNGNCDNTKICLIHRKVPLEEIIHKKVPLEEMT